MTPADRIRVLADAATPGPWEYTLDNGDESPAIYIPATAADRRSLPGIVRIMVPLHNANGGADAAYIAALSPDVARALADCLDELVEHRNCHDPKSTAAWYLRAALVALDAAMEDKP